MKTTAVAIVTLTLVVGAARADEKAAAPPAPKPAAELARLKALEGTWSCKGASPAGAMGPGPPEAKYISAFVIKPVFDGFAYTAAYEQKKTKEHPTRFAGGYSIGWDAAQKKMQWYWTDNVGDTGMETGGDWSGDDYVITGEGYLFGKTLALRDTFTKKGASGLHWKGEMKAPGATAWSLIAEDECTKK